MLVEQSLASAWFSLMLDIVREGGQIALSLAGRTPADLKSDFSVITEADRSISRLVRQRLEPLLCAGDHILIDEEDPDRERYLDDSVLARTPFVWAVDPIDATRAYANGMPHFGVSIGLLKESRPWMGAVLFPALGELFACDGDQAFFVRRAFTDSAVRTPITVQDEDISSRSVFICTDELVRDFEWDQRDCRVMMFGAAVCEFCWPAIGRGCGSLSRVHLWDLAGSWPVCDKAGLNLYELETGRILERIEAGIFQRADKAWRFKHNYILSSPRNFEALRGRIKLRPVIKGAL